MNPLNVRIIKRGVSILSLLGGLLWHGLPQAEQPVARFFYNEQGNVVRQEHFDASPVNIKYSPSVCSILE